MEVKNENFLSEKSEKRRNVTKVTLMSYEDFTAKKVRYFRPISNFRLSSQMRKNRQQGKILLLALMMLLAPVRAYAQSSSSSNYRVDQTIFGTGGNLDAQSTNFRSRQTIGELTIGQTDSANFRAFAGFNTTDEPYIEFVVTGTNIDLGYLDENATSTAESQFYVRAWQASGYVVRSESDPPTNSSGTGNQIDAMTTPGSPVPGTEQFGINLVANTCPSPSVDCSGTLGQDPQQSPDNTFSFGEAAPNYDTADTYTYNKGDIIARSLSSTSVTLYTISYVFNIDVDTLAGEYTFSHILVATGTY